MTTKYSAICCYFGKWPDYFQFWLDSCKLNTDITFIIVTDIPYDSYLVPSNVQIVKYTFAEVQEKIRRKFSNLKVSIEKPYKLCCFKAAFGYIFEDLFRDFDYWGFFDIDTIWGNIVRFIPENRDNHLIKIFPCGHLSFIKNSGIHKEPYKLINSMIKRGCNTYKGKTILPYEYVFTHPECFYYDELGGLEPLYKPDNNAYYDIDFSNVNPSDVNFHEINHPEIGRVIYKHTISGNTYKIYLNKFKLVQEEICYLHISRRSLIIKSEYSSDYLIIPNKIVPNKEITLLTFMLSSVNWDLKKHISNYIMKTKRKIKKLIKIVI